MSRAKMCQKLVINRSNAFDLELLHPELSTIMSVIASDWDTVSMKLENSIFEPTTRPSGGLKEPSLSTAIDLNDFKVVQFLAKTKGGLIHNGFRKKIWPLLIGIEDDEVTNLKSTTSSNDWESKPAHKDEDQVSLDVDRSFIYYPNNVQDKLKNDLKCKLRTLIVRILREHPQLSYYQGYHDICTVFLMVFQDEMELCFKCIENFTLLYLRDFMMPNINESVKILRLIPPLIEKIDKELYKDTLLGEIEPFYCLSPLITLFSHNITSLDTVCLIFDGIIANGSLDVILYYFVSFLIDQKDKIFEKITLLEEEDCFTKQDVIHDVLSKFLQNMDKSSVEQGIQNSVLISNKAPLKTLRPFKDIQENSVLRISPLVKDTDKYIIKETLNSITEEFLYKQINEAKKPAVKSPIKKLKFSIKDAVTNKQNQTLIKLSLTIGILSLLLNIILKKNDIFQLHTQITNLWNIHNDIINVGIRPIRDIFPKFF